MNTGKMNSVITFQRSYDDGVTWTDILTCYAYVNGVPNSEFFVANAGNNAALTVTISCRWQPELMEISPMDCRAVDSNNEKMIFELTHPADDVKSEHKEVIFRGKRYFA